MKKTKTAATDVGQGLRAEGEHARKAMEHKADEHSDVIKNKAKEARDAIESKAHEKGEKFTSASSPK